MLSTCSYTFARCSFLFGCGWSVFFVVALIVLVVIGAVVAFDGVLADIVVI